MKQNISELMDGESFEDEADHLLDHLRSDSALKRDWSAYHLIGDVLRQPDHIGSDLSAKINARLQNEPTVMAPRSRVGAQKIRVFSLSAAASLMALGLVVWMSGQIAPERTPKIALQQPTFLSASAQRPTGSNDYLLAHQEFSSGMDVSGGTAYIRTASYSTDAN
jgi:sigma-E factor negative regulatory protein RseA